MANFDSKEQINGSGLRCLRCGAAGVQVLREIRVASNSRFVDTQCRSCHEQSVLRLVKDDESKDAVAS